MVASRQENNREEKTPCRVVGVGDAMDLEQCLMRVQNGDRSAYEAFYNSTKNRIFNFIHRYIGDYHASEELTQEVFVKAYRHILQYKAQQKPLAWIYTIARNLCKNWFRMQKLRRFFSLDAPLGNNNAESPAPLGDSIPTQDLGPDHIVQNSEEHILLQKSILALPSPYREVLILCDMQGCDYRTAADVLNVSAGTVGSRLARARLKVASHIKAHCHQQTAG